MENQQQQPQNTPLCRANCGFYGSPATEDLCSKCFKDMIARKQETVNTTTSATNTTQRQTDSPPPAPDVNNTEISGITPTPASTSIEKSTDESDTKTATATEKPSTPDAAGKDKTRCHQCKKRVGFTGFECRCGGIYCGEHRYDTAHNCTFDYKTTGREELRKNNPQVISEKIQRI